MEYRFTRTMVDPVSISAYAVFLSRVYPNAKKITPEYLKWLYNDNPEGKVVGYDAFYNNTLVAHYVTIPVAYEIRNSKTKGLLALNTGTDNAHRGKGLFTQLAKKTYEDAIQMGYRFVIGVANSNSAPGYLKKLGFNLISPLDVRIGFGNINMNGKTEYSLRSLRSEEILRWRLSNPAGEYFQKKDFIMAKTGKIGVMAQLAQLENNFSLPIKKNPAISLWIGIDDQKKSNKLFIALPEKLKPSPLLLIFKDLTGSIELFQKKDVFFELIDFDAY